MSSAPGRHRRVRVGDRRVRVAGTGVIGEITRDEPHQRAAVVRRQQHEVVAGDRLVARRRELQPGRQVDPQLHAVRRAAVTERPLARDLVVQDPAAGGHPLRVALGDEAAAAVRVVVGDLPVEHVRDGLEPAVRVPRRALGLVRPVLHRPELVEQEEGIGDRQREAARERTPHLEAGALHRVGGRDHRVDGSRHRGGDVGTGDTGQDEWVFDSHSRHELVNLLACATIPPADAGRRSRSRAAPDASMGKQWDERLANVEALRARSGMGARGSRARARARDRSRPEPRWLPAEPRAPRTASGRPSPACPAWRSRPSSSGSPPPGSRPPTTSRMLYADARSHLTIARRLVDGPNHGIVQLGTVWLPLPHLALLPFVVVALRCGTPASPRSRSTSRAS